MSQNQAKSNNKDCSFGNRDSFIKGLGPEVLPGLHLLFVITGCPYYIHTVQLNEPRNYPDVILREAIITNQI